MDSTLGIRLGHFRYGYSLLSAYEQKSNGSNTGEMSRLISAPLRERKFPLPGSGFADYSNPPSPYPLYAFQSIVYFIASLLDYVL